MSTLTAPQHETAEAETRKRAQNRRRNADELWHLFSHTHHPHHAAQIADEATREDRAADQLTEAANYHADEAATKAAQAEEDEATQATHTATLDRANPAPTQ